MVSWDVVIITAFVVVALMIAMTITIGTQVNLSEKRELDLFPEPKLKYATLYATDATIDRWPYLKSAWERMDVIPKLIYVTEEKHKEDGVIVVKPQRGVPAEFTAKHLMLQYTTMFPGMTTTTDGAIPVDPVWFNHTAGSIGDKVSIRTVGYKNLALSYSMAQQDVWIAMIGTPDRKEMLKRIKRWYKESVTAEDKLFEWTNWYGKTKAVELDRVDSNKFMDANELYGTDMEIPSGDVDIQLSYLVSL